MKFSGPEKPAKISSERNSEEEQLVLNLEGGNEESKKDKEQQLALGMKGGAITPKVDKDGRFDRLSPDDLGPDE